MNELLALLRRHLRDWQSGWSMGSFGAIAEFHQDKREESLVAENGQLLRTTLRGAIRLRRDALSKISPVAYEALSPRPHRWSHAVALCLPEQEAARAKRKVLTEIGPDDDAIRGVDRTGILFDMGLSLNQCDFCIRTSDPALLPVLRANLGRSLFDHDDGAMPAILAAHPHRVALTNIGRVEVYQKIGGPDTGGVSPPGPHTHVLPKLLRSGRTHSANTPIPAGLVPLAYLHPGNPVIDEMGRDHPFDTSLFEAFQSLLQKYGLPAFVTAKQATIDAINRGLEPENFDAPEGRLERSALRLALRQQKRVAETADDPIRLKILAQWLAAYESKGSSGEEEDDAPGH